MQIIKHLTLAFIFLSVFSRLSLITKISFTIMKERSPGECFYRKYHAAVKEIGELAQDMDRWRALVGTVRDFRVP
jgi:hypothetical protein